MVNRFQISKQNKSRYFDTILILVLVLIIAFGLVMLYSASAYDGSLNYGDSAYYLKKQIKSTVFGLVVLLLATFIPYRIILKFSVPIYLVSLILVFLIIPLGTKAHGAKRWLYFFGISIQPAEIGKLAIIILMAALLVKMGRAIDTWKGLLVSLVPCLVLSGMIYGITSNLSSAIIVFSISVIMCFVASSDYKRYVFLLLGTGAIAAGIVFYLVKAQEGARTFRGERILAWLDPNAYASSRGYQTIQALYAIGSGGFMGKGIGQSMQKLGYIPEAQNDMIFAIICEEIGFVGAVCVILMFLLLLWRCLIIANNATDLAGSMLVVGFMAHIAIQVFLNIAVVTNTVPNTGISLPFISYGGSSAVSLLAEVGLVLNVQRSIKLREI